MKGQSSFSSGDLNLAAAMMTVGIPLDSKIPLELVAKCNGQDYVRFHFDQVSHCGKFRAVVMNEAWSNSIAFKRENPGNPFGIIMDFITARPNGCTNQDDWLCHAADFLGLSVKAVRQTYADISNTCKASPESPVSYVCGFIRNRMDLTHEIKTRGKNGDFKNMQSRGKSIAMISAKAPQRIKDFLLSKIR